MASIGDFFKPENFESIKKAKKAAEKAWLEKVVKNKEIQEVEQKESLAKLDQENTPYDTSEELEEYLAESDKYKIKKLKKATTKMFEAIKEGVGVEPIKRKPETLIDFVDETGKIAASKKPKPKKRATIKSSMKTGAPKTPDTTTPKIKRPDGISDAELENELKQRKAQEILKKMKKGDKLVYMGAPAEVLSYRISKGEVLIKTRVGEKTYNEAELMTLLQSGELKRATDNKNERTNTIKEIAQFIKEHGIDRVVVHGEPWSKENPETGEQELRKAVNLDFDTKIALFFLNYGQDFKQRRKGELGSSTIYNAGADTEFVNKGEQSSLTRPTMKKGIDTNTPLKPGSFVFHVDTGQRTLSIEKDGEVVMAFADHHAPTDSTETSATAMIFRLMKETHIYEEEPWMKETVKLTNEIDNLSYANKDTFTPGFFQEQWPKSLYALYEYIPAEKIIELMKEGRDPANPFTEEELDTITYKLEKNIDEVNAEGKKTGNKKVVVENLTIREIINKKIGQSVASSMKYLDDDKNSSLASMQAQGIKTESPLLGKVIFATKDDEINEKGEKITGNYLKYGYLAAKAKGYDTFASYNKQDDTFFINSTTKDLRPIIAEIQKIVPDTVLVRGVMIVPGKSKDGKDRMTKEKFLEICGMLDKDTKLNKYTPKTEKRPSVIEFQKEKARMKLESEIESLEERIQKKTYEIALLSQDRKINEVHMTEIEQNIAESETSERERARVEENKTISSALEAGRSLPSTQPVKSEEALTLYKGEGKEAVDTILDEFSEEKNKKEMEKIMQLLSKKGVMQKDIEKYLKELGKRIYTKVDLVNARRVHDIADANVRSAKLRKAPEKEVQDLEAKSKLGQRIYNIIKKKQRS